MKVKCNLQMIISLLFTTSIVMTQNIVLEYKDIQDPFSGFNSPIEIGILNFEGSSTFEENLYNALKTDEKTRERFRIYPYKTLTENKNALGLRSLSRNNGKVLKTLLNKLDIKFVLTGEVNIKKEVRLKIYKTSTEELVYNNGYKKSKNSEPIKDILKLFSDRKKAKYIKKPHCPKLVIYGGKTYKTKQIGNQCWLKENLNVGIRIKGSKDQRDNSRIEKYCYDDKESNCTKYGGFYQWDEAMQYITIEGAKGICPSDWHIPTNLEMQTLEAFVNDEAAKLVDESQTISGYKVTNEAGFSALFSGTHDYSYRSFTSSGLSTYFWSSTTGGGDFVDCLGLRYNRSNVIFGGYRKTFGFSIRCLKD